MLGPILRDVSRAFYLTLRVLPAGTRETVGTAYLLARAADTVADTRALPPPLRLELLLSFRDRLHRPGPVPDVRRLGDCSPGEAILLQHLGEAFGLLETLPPVDREAVRRIVTTLTRGMEMDLRTFPAEDSEAVGSLETPEELERYIYYVAGCVGEFWTEVTLAHTPALGWELERYQQIGIRFGKALQLTNVLRDVPKDLRNGRCYLPRSQLASHGLAPAELLEPSRSARAAPVLHHWIRVALDYYRSAEDYVLAIPCWFPRLRLAALWPVLIGLATLRIVAASPGWLDPGSRHKVGRPWIYRMMALSLLAFPFDGVLRGWFGALRRGVVETLAGGSPG